MVRSITSETQIQSKVNSSSFTHQNQKKINTYNLENSSIISLDSQKQARKLGPLEKFINALISLFTFPKSESCFKRVLRWAVAVPVLVLLSPLIMIVLILNACGFIVYDPD